MEERAAAGGTMSCQELLALSGALSAALPTGQVALDSFFEELSKGISKRAEEEKGDTKVRTSVLGGKYQVHRVHYTFYTTLY